MVKIGGNYGEGGEYEDYGYNREVGGVRSSIRMMEVGLVDGRCRHRFK